MRSIKWFVGAAIGALLLAPGFAKANNIQYVFVSGSFQPYSNVSGSGFNSPSKEGVNLISSTPPGTFTNWTLMVSGSSPSIQGEVDNASSIPMFKFWKGTMSIFSTSGNNATFAVTGIKYYYVDPSFQLYMPLNSSGSFTGSTTAWNGTTGKFNGQFNVSTPELGSSVAMATMLVGAGFLGFRKRR